MKTNPLNKSSVAFVSTFPPRQCGIATFTTDLTNAIDQMYGPSIGSVITAMNINEINPLPYPKKVIFQISQPNEKEYVDTANRINKLEKIKLVNIQHEFGIFGGEYGSLLLKFLEKLQKPAVTTFHTVLPYPNEKMFKVVQAISEYSKGLIVMTNFSKELLIKDYFLDPEKIHVIPHGIHHVPFKKSKNAKSALKLSGKLILSTFGFLNSGKGIEYIIESLPEVVKKYPNVIFLIIGVTHPVVLKEEGEKYRNFLIHRVYELGLNDHVLFYNNYFHPNHILKFLEATDIYLSPSLDSNQSVSGTLSYALGSGRPVISTAFSQAKEDITEKVGILVDFRNPQSFYNAICKLLDNNNLREQMGKNAYFRTRSRTWKNVALTYLKYFSQFAPDLIPEQKRLPVIKITHLAKLTDRFGIIQFANFTEPDISSGYTLDDNARALIVAALHYKKFRTPFSLKLACKYLNFIGGVAKPDGFFDNYIDQNRHIDKEKNLNENLEDASARALYALAHLSTNKQIPKHLRYQAHSAFRHSFQKNISFSSPRAIVFYIKALVCLLTKWKEPKTLAVLRNNCERLVSLYNENRSPDWEWFEPYLTYSNAILPEALALGFKITGDKKYLEVSEESFSFLIKNTFKDNLYFPIGQSGWFRKGETRHYFDQQPEDAAATAEALNTMYKITNKTHYKESAYKTFNWFLGDNVLGQVVYDRTTGGCYDGVGEKSINLNQGAESSISYLTARFSFED